MSQSIYVTLETLTTETSVPEMKNKDGKILRANMGSISHSLPRENYPTTEIFDNEVLFLEWAQERGALHAILQAGINDWLIADRAAFKRMVKGNWSESIGQSNVNDREWVVSTRPENAKTDEQKAKEAMAKLTPAQIAEIIKSMGK